MQQNNTRKYVNTKEKSLDRIRQAKRDENNYKIGRYQYLPIWLINQKRKVGANNAAPILIRNSLPNFPLKSDSKL